MAVCSDGESSIGEIDSLYQLQDGGLGGCSDGSSIPDCLVPSCRVGIFMAGTQPVQDSTTAAAVTSGSAAARAGGRVHSPDQVLMDLTDKLTTLLTAIVSPTDQASHDAEVAQLKLDMAQAKEDLAVEEVRITAEQAALDVQAQQIQAHAFQLT